MKKFFSHFIFASLGILLAASGAAASASISASNIKAGDRVEITGKIAPGQDLYIAVSQNEMFAPNDTKGVHEVKKFAKESKKREFSLDSKIPPLYYMITNVPDKFGTVDKKKFGGPSVLLGKGNGIYSTTMFYLKKKFTDIDDQARAMLGPIKSNSQWNLFRYANENSYGINTIVKEGNRIGKVVIFSRTVIGDESSGNYWDKGTKVELDKTTGAFTVSFDSFRHTPPNTQFDVLVNGAAIGSYTVGKKRFLAV